MVWVIPFCSPVAELNRWLGTQTLSGVDRSAQTREVHIQSPRIHLNTPPNPTCSRWYDHDWLKADYKPDSPPPTPTPDGTNWSCHEACRSRDMLIHSNGLILLSLKDCSHAVKVRMADPRKETMKMLLLILYIDQITLWWKITNSNLSWFSVSKDPTRMCAIVSLVSAC